MVFPLYDCYIIIAKKHGYKVLDAKFDLKVVGKTFIDAVPSLFMIVIIIGGITVGIFTATEAAGIAVCLIAYSHHACRTECDAMTAHYYRLREYAMQHPEAHAILRIID